MLDFCKSIFPSCALEDQKDYLDETKRPGDLSPKTYVKQVTSGDNQQATQILQAQCQCIFHPPTQPKGHFEEPWGSVLKQVRTSRWQRS